MWVRRENLRHAGGDCRRERRRAEGRAGQTAADQDIWITDLARDAATRLTFDPASDDVPVWSPDGSRVAFSSSRIGGVYNLYQRNANGTGADELLLQTPNHKIVSDWSADGRYLLYEVQDPTTKSDIWALPLFGDRKPLRLVGTPAVERSAALSPDGGWLAYVSDEGGANQVYVQGFPAPGGRWQVSTTRGSVPLWRSATELFYDAGSPLMAVDVATTTAGSEFKAGPPRELFRGLLAIWPHNMDVTRDGRRFLTLARPWTVVVPLQRVDEAVYEYACHEGNYAMRNILSGVRAQEPGR